MDILKPRCPICDWPLKETVREGCVEGNCSYRPQEGSSEYYRVQQRRDALRNSGKKVSLQDALNVSLDALRRS